MGCDVSVPVTSLHKFLQKAKQGLQLVRQPSFETLSPGDAARQLQCVAHLRLLTQKFRKRSVDPLQQLSPFRAFMWNGLAALQASTAAFAEQHLAAQATRTPSPSPAELKIIREVSKQRASRAWAFVIAAWPAEARRDEYFFVEKNFSSA